MKPGQESPASEWQSLPNHTVYDLSPPAAGVLLHLLARPLGAPRGYRVVMVPGFGQAAALKALDELTRKGYRHAFRNRVRGRIVECVHVYERPTSAETAEAEHDAHRAWEP